MKILHVITGLRKSAGTSTFAAEICNELVAAGRDVTIAVCNPDAADQYSLDSRVKLVSIASILASNLPHPYSIVHIHALWTPVLHKVVKWARRNGIPVVWSTHGMTAPWSLHHKWWKKCLPWLLYQKRDLESAALVHCTSDFEVEWNERLGLRKTFIAPLGTHLPPDPVNSSTRQSANPILLYVGRVYPVKALDRLIEAFAALPAEQRANWRLRIVGPDQDGHEKVLRALARDCGVGGCVEFLGPKYGDALGAEYEACDCLALVSHTENFGATVIDALAHGKPVLTSTKTPWKIVLDRGCGWWVDGKVDSLSHALGTLMSASREDLEEMGQRGRGLVEEKFTWGAVAGSIAAAYEAVKA